MLACDNTNTSHKRHVAYSYKHAVAKALTLHTMIRADIVGRNCWFD